MGAYMHVNGCVGEPFYGSLTLNVTIVYGFLEEYIPQDRVEWWLIRQSLLPDYFLPKVSEL